MDHIVWDIQKEIFKVGSWGPRWYGLMFAIGFLVGYETVKKIFQDEERKAEDLSSLLFYVMIGTLVGARLGHCLFYAPQYYLSRPWEIFYVWEGGLASHGGTLGVFASVWLFKRKHQEYGYIWLADRLTISIALAATCIRIGNFFNSEIVGTPSTVPWAIIFAQNGENFPRHPAMLYEAMSYFMLSSALWFLYKRTRASQPGQMLGLLLLWVFSSRFFLEFFKENQVAFEGNLPFNMGQILSVPFILLGAWLLSVGMGKRRT